MGAECFDFGLAETAGHDMITVFGKMEPDTRTDATGAPCNQRLFHCFIPSLFVIFNVGPTGQSVNMSGLAQWGFENEIGAGKDQTKTDAVIKGHWFFQDQG